MSSAHSAELDLQELDMLDNDLVGRMAGAKTFQEWWALREERSGLSIQRREIADVLGKSRFDKAEKLSDSEISQARSLIALYNKRRKTATQIIKALARKFGKLSMPDAARVYWTETKRDDTNAVLDLGEQVGFTTFKVILSPSACTVCRKKTNDGTRIFKASELSKSGHGHKPPFHPNCYCILVPHVE